MTKITRLKSENVGYYDGMIVLLFAILANLAAQSIFGFVIAVAQKLNPGFDWINNTYVQLVGMIIIQCFCIAAPIIYYAVIKKRSPIIAYGVKSKVSGYKFVFIPLLAIISITCFYLPAAWFDTFLTFIGYKGAGGIVLTTAPQIVLGFFIICVSAPIIEECIFRGFLLSGLSKKFGTLAAVLLSALAFSLMHMNPQQTVYQFFLGALCAITTISSGNILFGIGIHSLSNVIALLFDLTPLGALFTTFISFLTSTWWLSVISTIVLVAVGIALIYLCLRIIKKNKIASVQIPPLAPQLALQTSPLGSDNSSKNLPNSAQKNAQNDYAKNKLGARLYNITIVVCLVMWAFIFIVGMY